MTKPSSDMTLAQIADVSAAAISIQGQNFQNGFEVYGKMDTAQRISFWKAAQTAYVIEPTAESLWNICVQIGLAELVMRARELSNDCESSNTCGVPEEAECSGTTAGPG